MGIFSLLNFIKHHDKLNRFMKELGPYLSTECVLIVDTPNLLHRFHEHMKLDSLCGGQYEELYQGLLQFFSSLKEDCPGLRVILLLIEVTEEERLDVVRDWKVNKMKEWVEAIGQVRSVTSLPLCAWEVLYEVVRVCELETLCYDSEANDFISALALHYTQQGTPAFILSSNTDYYMRVGITGVLSLEKIVWDGTKAVLKKSRFFSLEDFLRTTHCSLWMVPLMALLLGNDRTPTELSPALEHIKRMYCSLTVNSSHPFDRVVLYFSRYTKTENATLDNIRNELKSELVPMFDSTYERNKKRYLDPLDIIPPGDIPTPRLSRMKGLYPGVSEQFLIRIAYLWNSRVLLVNKTSICAEDYRQPRAGLASLALRSYWHGVLLLPTQEGTGLEPPKHVTEICRRKGSQLYEEDMTTLGNVITDEQLEVFYKIEGRPLPSLAQIQEMPKADKYELFLNIMHCSTCALLLSNTDLIDHQVSVILFTLYYWYHQISFRETKSPSKATPQSVLKRQELLMALLYGALAIYFKDQLNLDVLTELDLRAVTLHDSYHSVAEWLSILQDTNILLLLLDLPAFSIRRSYDGHILFRVITDLEYSNSVESQLSSLMGAELHNIREALLTPCTEPE